MDVLGWESRRELLDRWIDEKSEPSDFIPADRLPKEKQNIHSFDSTNQRARERRAALDGYAHRGKHQSAYGSFHLNSEIADVDRMRKVTARTQLPTLSKYDQGDCSSEEETGPDSTHHSADLFDVGVEMESPFVVPNTPSPQRPSACVYSETLPKIFRVDGYYYARSSTRDTHGVQLMQASESLIGDVAPPNMYVADATRCRSFTPTEHNQMWSTHQQSAMPECNFTFHNYTWKFTKGVSCLCDVPPLPTVVLPACFLLRSLESDSVYPPPSLSTLKLTYDPLVYPERHRRDQREKPRGSHHSTRAPGQLLWATNRTNDSHLEGVLLLRPEYQHVKSVECYDVNKVFWGTQKAKVSISDVANRVRLYRARCDPHTVYGESTLYCTNVPPEFHGDVPERPPDHEIRLPGSHAPLRTFDAFCGAGGLSLGMEKSGLCKTMWALDVEREAMRTFCDNRGAETSCYVKNISEVLDCVENDPKQTYYPRPGQVECLVGGPPCQGFSSANFFPAGDNAREKRFLMVEYLRMCKIYSPKLVVLENVQNFATQEAGSVFRSVLLFLISAGYEVVCGIMQAGMYGLPQSRRRVIIVASKDGFPLPDMLPPQLHAFAPSTLSLTVGGVKFDPLHQTVPIYRTVTLREAIVDLQNVNARMSNGGTWYARSMGAPALVLNHKLKPVSLAQQARINRIPYAAGADWRDLPNVPVNLADGSRLERLEYLQDGSVCPCRGGGRCMKNLPKDSKRKPPKTLIPWFLPHTAHRNSKWIGCYGRLDWEGYVGTLLTSPVLSHKQGCLLHPSRARLLTVREYARVQGFPDTYIFKGTIKSMYKQIGNAVPPPLACALGKRILHGMYLR